MGGSHITARGVHVEPGGFAVMGGNHLRVEQATPPQPDVPVVRVRADSVMGGTHVKLRPPPALDSRDFPGRRSHSRPADRPPGG